MRLKDDKKIEQVFQSTLEVVEDSGLAGINMCDVSRSAGIATGTLYIYFKNKEELINELFTNCRRESASYYFKDYDENEEFESSFKKIFYNILNYKLTNFRKSIFLEQYFHSPYVTEKKRQESNRLLQPFFELMDKGKSIGNIKKIDSLLLLWFVIGCINEVIKGSHYRKRPVTEDVKDEMYSFCRNGMAS
ncbi:MAG: TetR/AcrR family transcriptional regulator [Flavisolibacter sp.]